MSIMDELLPEQDTETVDAALLADAALESPDATEDPVEPASEILKKRGRPKGSKDAQPRTRTKPEVTHTPSKAYTYEKSESPLLVHLEEAMADARQQELIKKQNLYQSWLPY